MKNTKGITLIALIITIIVMLILVAVSIRVALNTGLFQSAATKNWKTAQDEEANGGRIIIGDKEYASIEDYIAANNNDSDSAWDKILEDANKNPEKYRHPDQQDTNKDIGIGTDGKPVNLDYWYYDITNVFNEQPEEVMTLIQMQSSGYVGGYNPAEIENGEIKGKVPQYIKRAEDDTFYPVESMYHTFFACNLVHAPEIPTTVKYMNICF